jgi:hypothetical protein
MAGPTRDGGPDSGEPLDDATVAERWAELTADLGELHVPSAEELRPTAPVPPEPQPPRPVPAPGPRDYEAAPEREDDDEDPSSGIDGFVPPDPEPLTHADPALTLGWVATIGSLLLGLVLFVLDRSVPTWLVATLAVALLGGVGLLLWRMPARPEDRGPGDGAVV